MKQSTLASHLRLALVLGSLWGLSEAALGMGLKACAASVSGSVMTGVALFFIAAGWAATGRMIVPVIIVLLAGAFKLFDAVLLSLPLMHGAIGNPVFAFLLEGFAFLLLVYVTGRSRLGKRWGQMLLGGGAALVAVALFPLVKFVTAVPACVYAGTTIPLSIYFGPVAIILSAATVPLGFYLGEQVKYGHRADILLRGKGTWGMLVPPATFMACLVLVSLIRIFVPLNFS